MPDENFVEWLRGELHSRNWSQADLMRASRLTRGTVSNLLNQKRKPGITACEAIATAFGLPVRLVMEKAGHLSADAEISDLIETTLYSLGALPIEDQEEILEFIKLKKALRERREKYK